jgi:serine/threonine-protein kinase RsbW
MEYRVTMSVEKRRHEFDPDTLKSRVDLTIPGEVGAIAPAVDTIMANVREMGCAAGKEFEIELALTEALANAVIHGCEHDPGKDVQVCAGCDPARGILIVVRDPGPGFDPSQVPSPVVGEKVFAEGGRGIYLINRLMDHVEYGDGGTEIRMLKH